MWITIAPPITTPGSLCHCRTTTTIFSPSQPRGTKRRPPQSKRRSHKLTLLLETLPHLSPISRTAAASATKTTTSTLHRPNHFLNPPHRLPAITLTADISRCNRLSIFLLLVISKIALGLAFIFWNALSHGFVIFFFFFTENEARETPNLHAIRGKGSTFTRAHTKEP